MATDTELVVVRKSYLSLLQDHCNCCPSLGVRQRITLLENYVEIPYTPKERTKRKHPTSLEGRSKKLQARDSFLRNLPEVSQWRSRQEHVVGGVEKYEETIRCLIRGNKVNVAEEPSRRLVESQDHLILIGRRLALWTDASLRAEALQRSFASFQAFLFLSYCGLLEKRGISHEVVDQITQCVSSFRESDRNRLRSHALRVNVFIQELVERGWSIHRATELFFLNPLSPTYLLSIDEAGFQHILKRLTTKEYLDYQFDDCFGPQYTIPDLITQLIYESDASETLSAREICEGLQYKYVVSEPLDRIFTVRRSIQRKPNAPLIIVHTPDSYRRETQPPPQATDLPRQDVGFVYRTSLRLRSSGRISESERMITEFLDSQTHNVKDESRHALGFLSLSQARNAIYRFDFSKASEESRKWQPSDGTLSGHELFLLCDQLSINGRILKGKGHFAEAKRCFEGCLATPGLTKSKRTIAICHLSEIYCELDYVTQNPVSELGSQLQYLSQGRVIIQSQIACDGTYDQDSRNLRRLLLALTEIEIRQGRSDEAERWINKLLGIYSTIEEPNIDDKVGHVRTLMARARISELHEAENKWTDALLRNKIYNPVEEEVFTCGFIYLCIASVRSRLGDIANSREMFQRAERVIRKKRPQFLMPGVGTYLFDTVRSELKSMAGLVLQEIAQ